MPRAKNFIATIAVLGAIAIQAQGLRVYPLAARWSEPQQSEQSLMWGVTDTLSLPFFEDFAENRNTPNPNRWTGRQVWLNSGFSKTLPNIQAATFDHLDEWGQPYSALDQNARTYADTLCSQPINLQFYKEGPGTVNYKPSDSLYLSFFVERGGWGDSPESTDSLLLQFKTTTGEWISVWNITGTSSLSKEYFVPITEYRFLSSTFQFRFYNYTKSTGNLNHWNLDYIRLNKNRRFQEQNIQDVGIAHFKPGLFNDYYNIPFSHYAANIVQSQGNGTQMKVRNAGSEAVQIRTLLDVKNQYGQTIYAKPLGSGSIKIDGLSDFTQTIELTKFDTLSTLSPELTFDIRINPENRDSTPILYHSATSNNRWEHTHKIQPWYAYDDGSAEGGFGLDYAHLGNIKGQFAMEFNTYKDDSLRGLAIQFNQSKTDVSTKSFRLRIWKELSPLSGPDNQDKLIYEWFMDAPVYRDSVNEFSYVFFDSVLFLPKGKYYVGWMQALPFVLNIGYDNNYRFSNDEQVANPHLFYNLLGSWEHADYSIKGTPMIRILMGGREEYLFDQEEVPVLQISAYPNPCIEQLTVQGIAPELVSDVAIVDGTGRLLPVLWDSGKIDVSHLSNGRYTLVLRTVQGQKAYWHFVKLGS
jgi:hypothetical protein